VIIHLNGIKNKIEVPTLTLQALVSEKFPSLSAFAIAVNDQIVPRSELPGFQISEGDRIEIIQPVGGG
jgi:thiamine biosynthesis protein ThiS